MAATSSRREPAGGAARRPVRRRTVSQELVERLSAEIGRGRLKPGERLRSERDLSVAYDVSRASVREAIRTLESRGLVEGRHGRGTFVRTPSVEALVQIPAGPVPVTEEGVRQLYQVRLLLEPGIVRHAAEQASAADLTGLRRLMEKQEQGSESTRYTSDDDTRFHLALAGLTGNPLLVRLLEGVMTLLAVVREPALKAASASGLRLTLDGHRAITDALEARDADAAEAAMRAHLERAEALAVRVVQEQG